MNMPLFTAEASLYKTSKLYVMTGGRGPTQGGVVPQAAKLLLGEVCGPKIPGGFGSCMTKCCNFYCETQYPFNCRINYDECTLREVTCGIFYSFGF